MWESRYFIVCLGQIQQFFDVFFVTTTMMFIILQPQGVDPATHKKFAKKCINFRTFNTLNRIDDDGDGSIGQRFKTLLRIDIDAGQPTTETRVTMVPTDNHFRASRLFQHIQHFGLENGIDGFDADAL
uniref:Uncharacterized protein n=1 Tax=Romanomermis culicivorax TaxID=13658 RepID=A0A915IMT9_ROMCU